MNGKIDDAALEERKKFVIAWNKTMVTIWKERITMLEALDTGSLLNSVAALPVKADGRFIEMTLSQEFLGYGLYVNYGVGKEVYRGNGGDIGRAKVRQRKPWFDKKYYSSIMVFNNFMAENMGEEFTNTISSLFDMKIMRERLQQK